MAVEFAIDNVGEFEKITNQGLSLIEAGLGLEDGELTIWSTELENLAHEMVHIVHKGIRGENMESQETILLSRVKSLIAKNKYRYVSYLMENSSP